MSASTTRCALVCTSHSPLLNVPGAAPPDVDVEIRDHTARVARFVAEFAPDLVVQFGDDHASAFNLGLMPAFCVGLRANALGDFHTSRGPVRTDEAAGRALVQHLHAQGIDVAFSYRMTVDHGFVQALDLLFGGVDRVPVVPVMINCGGELRPPLARALALGRAIGAWLATLESRRVLILGSGGLSHDPPLAEFASAAPDAQERLIVGTDYTPERLAERTRNVHRAGIDFAGPNSMGLLPLDADWDRWFLARAAAGDLDALVAIDDAELRRVAGRGGAEIRNWIAALAAMQVAAGDYAAQIDYYRPVPELICGYGILHAAARA